MEEPFKNPTELAAERMLELNRKPINERLKQPGDAPCLDNLIPDVTPPKNSGAKH